MHPSFWSRHCGHWLSGESYFRSGERFSHDSPVIQSQGSCNSLETHALGTHFLETQTLETQTCCFGGKRHVYLHEDAHLPYNMRIFIQFYTKKSASGWFFGDLFVGHCCILSVIFLQHCIPNYMKITPQKLKYK